jgi:hypothetical protein
MRVSWYKIDMEIKLTAVFRYPFDKRGITLWECFCRGFRSDLYSARELAQLG